MERPSFTLFHNCLPAHHLLVVGATARFHLRQPPDDALSRLWIF